MFVIVLARVIITITITTVWPLWLYLLFVIWHRCRYRAVGRGVMSSSSYWHLCYLSLGRTPDSCSCCSIAPPATTVEISSQHYHLYENENVVPVGETAMAPAANRDEGGWETWLLNFVRYLYSVDPNYLPLFKLHLYGCLCESFFWHFLWHFQPWSIMSTWKEICTGMVNAIDMIFYC